MMTIDLPANNIISNKPVTCISKNFSIMNNVTTSSKIISNLQANDQQYIFTSAKNLKEFYISDINNERLVTFQQVKFDGIQSTLLVLFEASNNYISASIQIELGMYTKLILKDNNQNEHIYKLKEHETTSSKTNSELNLYYSNSIKKDALVGNVVVDLHEKNSSLDVFNLNIQVDKQLETLILGLVLINVYIKERS